MEGDARSFRVALVADRLVNPPPGEIDGLSVAVETGWGVLQLPADDYPEAVRTPMLREIAEHAEEFSRRGYDVVLIGEDGGLAAALAELGAVAPQQCRPADVEELRCFLLSRPAPRAASVV